VATAAAAAEEEEEAAGGFDASTTVRDEISEAAAVAASAAAGSTGASTRLGGTETGSSTVNLTFLAAGSFELLVTAVGREGGGGGEVDSARFGALALLVGTGADMLSASSGTRTEQKVRIPRQSMRLQERRVIV
jgi:hypothetical protein